MANPNIGVNRRISDREHLLSRPEMYLNNVVASHGKHIVENRKGTLEVRECSVNFGLVHTLVEIMSNATDNATTNGEVAKLAEQLSKVRGAAEIERICKQSGAHIVVELTSTRFAVKNYGPPFDIDFMAAMPGIYVPEACFTMVKVGSNFDDSSRPRIGAGRNGYGAKITLTYSKYISVECVDIVRRRYFHMTMQNNGDPDTKVIYVWPPPIPGEEHVRDGTNCPIPPSERAAAAFAEGRSFTRIEWVPDSEEGDIPPEAIQQWSTCCQVGDLLEVRRRSDRNETETHQFTVTSAGPDLWVTAGASPFRLAGARGIKLLRNVTRRTSIPATALIFQGSTGISDDEIDLAARRTLDFATCGIPFTLRRQWADGTTDERFVPPITVLEYGRLLFGKECKSIALDWTSKKSKKELRCNVAFFDTPGAGIQIGFANGLFTSEGMHMSAANSALFSRIKENPAIQKYAPSCTVRDFKQHFSAVVWVFGENPTQEGQAKSGLSMISGLKSFEMSGFAEDDVNAICSGPKTWGAALALMDAGKRAELDSLRQSVKNVDWPKYMPANELGPGSVLAVAEGLSCTAFLAILRNLMVNSDRVGIGPLRGVPANLYGCDATALMTNLTFSRVISKMGLDPSKTYTTTAEINTLKYGSIVFVGDPDLDGFHIIGLLAATFYHYWPALFAQRRIGVLRTPTVRIYSGNTIVARYYSDKEFDMAVADGTAPKGRAKRFKGLASIDIGSLTRPGAEVRDDYKHATLMWFDVNEQGSLAIRDFFHSGNAAARKYQITRLASTCNDPFVPMPNPECSIPNIGEGPVVQRPIEDYIGKEVVQYSIGALLRHIPSIRDGMKDVVRKILWWWLAHSDFGRKSPEHKVDRMCGMISAAQQYHHGPTSMGEAIKAVSLGGFCGANNLPLLCACSNGGTKLDWPHDAGADRYVIVTGSPWLKYAFNPTVCRAVPRKISDDEEIEPEFIPCALPICLANGFSGVATGWATTHPACHPGSLLEWLIARAQRDLGAPIAQMPEVLYWYDKFEGTMHLTHAQQTATIEIPAEDAPAEDAAPHVINVTGARSLIARGKYTMRPAVGKETRDGTVMIMTITEVPPSVRLSRLNDSIAQMEREGYVAKYRCDLKKGIHYDVHLTATGLGLGREEVERRIMHSVSHPLGNFYLLDSQGAPVKIANHYEYLEIYYGQMLTAYAAGKDLMLREISAKIADLRARYRYIEACVVGRIVLGKMPRDAYVAALQEIQVSHDIAKRVDGFHLTIEAAEELRKEISDAEAEAANIAARPTSDMYLSDLLVLQKHLPKTPAPRRIDATSWGPGV